MDQQIDELKKNIVLYYNCKIAPEVFSFNYGYCTDEDVIKVGERIIITICAGYVPQFNTYEDCVNNKRSSELHYVSMDIDTYNGINSIYSPFCGFSFDLDKKHKNVIESNLLGCPRRCSGTMAFKALGAIFNEWNSSMDQFIDNLKLLNISLV